MTLVTQLTDLTTRIATETKALRTLINSNAIDLSALTTASKVSLVSALNEVRVLASGAGTISDGTTTTTSTWSSTKTNASITAAVNALIAAAPGLLDTLNEIAAALGDDPNFATTMTTALANKQPLDADLTSIAALGTGAWSLATVTAFAQTLLDDADAPTMRTTLGLGTAATTATTAYEATGSVAAASVTDRARANHTGTQLAATVSDFTPAVQLMLDDLAWKIPVEVASTGNLTLSAPQTVDGVAAVAGNRVLVKDQTVNTQNGIYIVAAGAWVRSTGTDTPVGLNGAQVTVKNGTTQMDTIWSQTATIVTIGTSPVIWVRRPTMADNTADRARANHTGTQLAATISDFAAAADARVVAGITAKQPLDTDLTAIAALVSAADRLPYATGTGLWALATFTAFARTLLDDIDAPTMRTTLGLGTAATTAATAYDAAGVAATAQAFAIQRANHTGTQLAATISDFNTVADARVVAGITGKQPLDADLTAIAALGTGAWSLSTFTPFAQTLVDDVDAATMRATLGLGTAATTASTAYEAAGAVAAASITDRARANHTGTQLAATISDFSAAVVALVGSMSTDFVATFNLAIQ